MKRLRVVTVDDETLALRRLHLLLRPMTAVDHVGEANSCRNAMALIDACAPDLVLLDVKMRDGDGFAVIEQLATRPRPPAVILVTAFDRFAVRAFDEGVVDYLLKPIERQRLEQALARVQAQLDQEGRERRMAGLQMTVNRLRQARAGKDSSFEHEFWVRTASGMIRVPVENISCVSSEDDYVAIHTDDGSYLIRGSIRQFEGRVAPGDFVRVHRTWLVRKSDIRELHTPRLGGAEVLLQSGRRIPVGRVHLKSLKHQILSA